MSRLPDPKRSYAVLIGASSYQSPDLPDLPAVRNNLAAMIDALTNPEWGGFTRDRCSVIGDSAVVLGASRLVRECAAKAEDTFVVYFAGHGLTGPIRNDLFLALSDTDPHELRLSALSFDLFREIFLDCPAANRVLILDCCFSGRVTQGFMSAARDVTLGQVEIAGTYTMASAPPNALALAPVGATYTVFTGELLNLLRHGLPDGPELLSLGTVFRKLRHTMATKGYPQPGQRGTDSADQLALTRNPGYRPEPIPVPDVLPSTRRPRLKPKILAVGMAGAVVAASIITWIAIDSRSPSANSNMSTQSSTSSSVPTILGPTLDTSSQQTAASTSRTSSASPVNNRSQPVRVYNNSTIHGLADRAADDFRGAGWNVTDVGNHQGLIPTTTVYFRPGTEEEPEAKELARQFGLRAEPRIEGIKNSSPGIIVIVDREYNPRSK